MYGDAFARCVLAGSNLPNELTTDMLVILTS